MDLQPQLESISVLYCLVEGRRWGQSQLSWTIFTYLSVFYLGVLDIITDGQRSYKIWLNCLTCHKDKE